MIGHYIVLALRAFRRRKVSSTIKVLALAMGLACFISAHMISDYFSSVDSGFAKSSRTYLVRTELQWPGSTTALPFQPTTAGPVAAALKAEIPQIEETLRTAGGDQDLIKSGDQSSFRRVEYAEPNFFNVFEFRFLAGNAADALTKPHSAVLSQAAAMALFGRTDVIGETLTLNTFIDLTITGVVAPPTPPSTFGYSITSQPFEVLASMDVFDDLVQSDNKIRPSQDPTAWFVPYFATYLVFRKDGSLTLADFNHRVEGFGERHFPKEQGNARFDAIPLSSLTLDTINRQLFDGRSGLSITVILYLFGGLILGISCLDFANLATAEAAGRAKEVGMRKVLGASRIQVLGQSLVEVFLLCLAASVLALVAAALVIMFANQPNDLGFRFPSIANFGFWGFLAAVIAGTTVVGGLYPALVLAGVRPLLALRAASARGGSPFMRTILVGVQFTAASFLIVGVLVLYSQSRAVMREGLDRFDDPVIFMLTNLLSVGPDRETFRNALLADASIKSVSGAQSPPYSGRSALLDVSRTPEGSSKTVSLHLAPVDYDYFKTLKINLLAGRTFSRDHDDVNPGFRESMNRTAPVSHVFDVTTVKALGWDNPADAVDQIVYEHIPGIQEFGGKAFVVPLKIIGVSEREPFEIVQAGSPNFAYYLMPRRTNFALIRIDKDHVKQGLAHIDTVWKRLAPNAPVVRQFLNERFAQSYSLYNMINRILIGLASFAVVIATMGLIGMATYTVGRRVREIGVRKTLGATTTQILRLLLWEHSKPVLIANLIAWPLAYLAAESYLTQFLTRASLTPVPFVFSLVVTLVVAWAAVGGQAWKSARLKPANVLKYE